MQIDVYDFDGTIYRGDSTVDFILYCVKKKKSLLILLLLIIPDAIRLLLTRDLTVFKSHLFGHMAKRINLCEWAEEFWSQPETRDKINSFFFNTRRDYSIIIASASPDFELRYAMEIIRPDALICTECDPRTGQVIGKNCKSSEKIRKIKEKYGEFTVEAMYTDSVKADGPLLNIAKEKYLVKDGTVSRIIP